VVINGGDFTQAVGTPVEVLFIATTGTPFAGGTKDREAVVGTVTSPSTIAVTTPAAVICGPVAINANVMVTLASGVFGATAAPVIAFSAPSVTLISGGGTFPAAIPTPFTLTGTGFGPVGGMVTITWMSPASIFLGGAANTVTTPGTIMDPTTISGISPPAAVCGPGLTMQAASITQVAFPDGSCTPMAAPPLAVSFTAPTITNIDNDAMAGTTFLATRSDPFTITGTDFGPLGGVAFVTFQSTSAAPADMPFAGNASIIVTGVVTSTTTITGMSPEATLVPASLPTPATCFAQDALASVDVQLGGGSCTPAPFLSATFAGPTVTGLAVGGFTAPAVPSTVLLGSALPESFTITGTGFHPPGATATVAFEDLAAGGAFDGGADMASVPGTVVNATTVIGMLPTITTTRLAANLTTRVRVTCANGSGAYCNDAANFIAPPTVTGITSSLAVREGGASTFLSACRTQMQIAGTAFDAAASVAISDAGGTPLATIGSGALDAPVITPTLVTGGSPLDPGMLADTNARARVVNPDQQFHDYTDAATPFEFVTLGHLQNSNVSQQAANHNAEMEAAVDPTNPNNMASLVHNINFGVVTILLAHSEDGGTTWTQNLIGPGVDGLAADRIDPRVNYDRFGNLYVCYFNRAPRTLIVLQSFDNGATFPFIRTVFADPSIDKEFLVTGPDGANPAQEAIYVGWDSGPAATGTSGIVASGATCTGAGAPLSVFSPPVQVASNAALGGPQQFSNAEVGPNGDLLVVWNDRSADGGGIGPVPIRLAIDPLGLFAGAGFGASIVVDISNVGGFEPVAPEPVRTIFAIPDVAVVKSGAYLGRIVVSYSTEIPDNSDDLDVTVRFSDNGGLTWSPRIRVNDDFTTTTQMLPALRVDPVSGTLVMAWYDARNDTTNNRRIQIYASASFDGGTSWQQNMLVSDGTSDQATFAPGLAAGNEFLDYIGLRAHDGCALVSWGDNSNFAGGGTASCENYVSRFQLK
jgi:hypothetical protein